VVRADCSLEQFRNAVKKVRCRFTGPILPKVNIDGLLHFRQSADELELVLVGTDDKEIADWAGSSGVVEYRAVNMNLEDQFIEYTAPAGRMKLFQWEEK